jgi:beta-phosphoglucomutase-like phosphatase (HAD superfamily)
VLIDSEHIHAEIESQALGQVGITIPPEEITKRYSGTKIEEEFNDAVKKSGKRVDLELLMKIRNKLIEEDFVKKVGTISFAQEVMEELSKKYKQALATSTEQLYAEAVLDRNKLLNLFNAKMFGTMVKKSKPNPEIFLKAADLLKVKPHESVVVEDSIHGFNAAKSAGMALIARKGNHNQTIDFSLADFIIEDLREIPDILQSINNRAMEQYNN